MKLNFFKKAKPVVPNFEALYHSPLKDQYFYRTRQWLRGNNDNITIIDNTAPRVITMDPWPQMIFLDATGKQTINEYVNFIAGKYKNNVPADLDTTILSMIDLLLKENVICLSTVPREPDPQHQVPVSK
ncbi:hypothetical protein [Chitinophaga qingshengii]|uniref:PqqD family protein n=1 Tax=Chitinophaga qingshengii TaxID=1569794 RepID=A0ABR7TG51_9BACT|nr:hypothetical protein [Chitinophaga qingshengii]MBC9929387.1 hypothetical protein [Chitinophaga qingshengii]